MSVADEITSLTTYLTNAYNVLESKGATMPTNKNMASLADTVDTISGGGTPTPTYPYDIPEFDGGNYGAVAYLKPDKTVGYYTALNSTDLSNLNTNQTYATIKTLSDGTTITKDNLLAYSIGTYNAALGNYFLARCSNLQNLYGMEKVTAIGNNFMTGCYSFNQPLTIPGTVTSIGNTFLDSRAFNQPITISEGVTTIGNNFLVGCTAFNQPINIPNTVTSIGSYFLSDNHVFNQSVTIPNSVKSIGDAFLNSCYGFNQPLTIPEGVTTIGNNFLASCVIFNQPINIPNTVTSIGSYFLYNCSLLQQSVTISNSVTTINGYFMQGCNYFTGPLNVGTTAHPSDSYSLSTNSTLAPMYATGIMLEGTGKQAWKDALPDHGTNPYRKLILAS